MSEFKGGIIGLGSNDLGEKELLSPKDTIREQLKREEQMARDEISALIADIDKILLEEISRPKFYAALLIFGQKIAKLGSAIRSSNMKNEVDSIIKYNNDLKNHIFIDRKEELNIFSIDYENQLGKEIGELEMKLRVNITLLFEAIDVVKTGYTALSGSILEELGNRIVEVVLVLESLEKELQAKKELLDGIRVSKGSKNLLYPEPLPKDISLIIKKPKKTY